MRAPIRRHPTWVLVDGSRTALDLLFDVANEAARLIDRRLLETAKAAGDDLDIQAMGHSAFRALNLIEEFPGIIPTQVAREMHVTQNTIAGLLNRLESAGLISRERERYRDRRMLKLYCTDKGRIIAARMRAIAGAVDAFVVAALTRWRGNPIEAFEQALEELTYAQP